jgi:DNA mismatch repair protein MSH5
VINICPRNSLLALSHVAGQYAMTKPELRINEQLIDIKNGRHILTQDQVEVFIPNDFKSSATDSLVKIFTGPNSCGKSVYLKQVKLILVYRNLAPRVYLFETQFPLL